MHPQAPCWTQLRVQEKRQRKEKELGALPRSQHFEGRGACWSSGMGLGRLISKSITHTDLHKPNNKLVRV
jgi:hypothetical protein